LSSFSGALPTDSEGLKRNPYILQADVLQRLARLHWCEQFSEKISVVDVGSNVADCEVGFSFDMMMKPMMEYVDIPGLILILRIFEE
jgi:hypothetical protein